MTQNQALAILKTGVNVFLTGEPGSGKTFTINEYVKYLRSHGIEPAITASTGIAATHLNGMTIHSWSGIGINKFLSQRDLEKIYLNGKLYKRIIDTHVLIIDEISMLDAQTLSLVDQVCQTIKESEAPFGGIQIIFVGDFFQLPPVSRDTKALFAYESQSWLNANPTICYITEQHRQEDEQFLDLLGAIRRNLLEDSHHSHLTNCLRSESSCSNNITKLYSHNTDVDRLNLDKLSKIGGIAKEFEMTSIGKKNLVEALIKGCLSPEVLTLKEDAVVMFTKNNPKEGYYNGSIGTVVGFSHNNLPLVRLKNGQRVEVEPADWSILENDKVLATITQVPLRLAWAITIHKSQGMSLDAAVVDLRQVFEYGQGYVALSRIRSLEGLHLLGYNRNSLLVHPEILVKDQEFRNLSGKAYLDLMEIDEKLLVENWQDFILSVGGTIKEVEYKEPKSKSSTCDQTLFLLQEGKSIEEIAEVRELSISTIINHLEKLAENKDVQPLIKKLIPQKIKKNSKIISKVLEENGGKLTPTFSHFKKKYTFDELKLAKIFTDIKS